MNVDLLNDFYHFSLFSSISAIFHHTFMIFTILMTCQQVFSSFSCFVVAVHRLIFFNPYLFVF